MGPYFAFLSAILTSLGQNIAGIFTGRGFNVIEHFNGYHQIFLAYQADFGPAGWIFFVLMIVLAIVIVGGLAYLLILAFRKLRLKGKAGSKNEEKMLDEIERLNLEIYDLRQENDKLIGLTRVGDGLDASAIAGRGKKEDTAGGPRFIRLSGIDEEYPEGMLHVKLPDDASNIDLAGICERFRNFACSQLKIYYTIDTVREFFAAMGTGKLIILEGISGTGKTSMPYSLGRFFRHSAAICPVQPNWRDRSELLGYYNDFTKRFTETSFLTAVYEATYRDDVSLIVLDEMNLARIEYYFAEFLSIMEMPNPKEWLVDVIAGHRDDDPKNIVKGKLLIPQNIWFVGTANNDDSTFTITDKVYDRAMSLFFENKGIPFEAPFTEALPLPADYLNNLYEQAKKDHPMSQDTMEKFMTLDDYVIEHFHLAFGNRIMKQLQAFIPCYIACGGTELEALDFCFKTKILKKFEVLNVGFLGDELVALDEMLTKLFGPSDFQLSRAKIQLLIKMSK